MDGRGRPRLERAAESNAGAVAEELVQRIEFGARVFGPPALALVMIQARFAGLTFEVEQDIDALERAGRSRRVAMLGNFEELATGMRPRLHGCRRYEPMDGRGRPRLERAAESNAGAVAEQATSWMCGDCRYKPS